jgi:hypothetical protein
MSTSKAQRALVVVSELDLDPQTAWLYRGLETTGRFVVEQMGAQHYAHVRKLYDQKATLGKLVGALADAAGTPGIREVDVVIMLHGSSEVLVFAGNTDVKTATLRDRIADLGIAAKLRLAYSTACFGASHADDLVAAGFTAAVGARKVNANGGIEVPVFTGQWPGNRKLSEVMATAQIGREAQDTAAEVVGGLTGASWAGQVDSSKVVRGNAAITVTTSAG